MKSTTTILAATLLASGIAFAATGTWDTNTITTTPEVTAPPTGAGILVSNALTTLNAAATGSDGSLVTSSVLSDAGLTSVSTIYLSSYQSAFASATGVTGLTAAQAIIDNTNSNSAPIVIATPVITAPIENTLYNYVTPASSYFSGSGTLTLSASSLPSWLSFDGSSLSGTPTISGPHTITLTATDAAGASVSSSFSFTITNVNDAPVASDASLTLAENSSSGAVVGTVASVDEDNDSLSWSLSGTGSSNFAISSAGQISVASGASLDYETTNNFSITATANDGNGGSDTASVSIALTNVDEGGPVFASATPTISPTTVVPGTSTPIHTFVATDPDNDAVTFSTTTVGFSVGASTGVLIPTTVSSGTTAVLVTATANGVSTNHTISVSVQAAADAIADTTATVTSGQLSGVVSANVLTDLTSNNNCGAAGTTNCLDAFNTAKATTSCALAGGTSASNAQVATYVDCVMRQVNVAAIDSVAGSYTSASTESSTSACAASINLSLPSPCGHPQWSCSIQGTPSPASGYSATTGLSDSLSLAHSFNGSPATVSYTIRASLGIYSPSYTKDFTYTSVVPAYLPTTQRFTGNWTGTDATGAWNSCVDKGGILANQQQIFDVESFSNWDNSGIYVTYNHNRTLTNYTTCSNGDHAGTVNNDNGSGSGWTTMRSNGTTRYKARDENGNIVLRSSDCKGSGTQRNGTTTYWCADMPSACPG